MKYLSITDTDLIEIADAIRSKTGKTAELTLEQMSIEIAGITGGGRPKSLLYELPSPMEFDGESTYIDTGIQLMKEADDFSIVFDFVNGIGPNQEPTIFHCMHETYPYYGISFQRCAAYTAYVGKWQFAYYDATRYADVNVDTQSEDRYRVVISGSGEKINTFIVHNVTTGAEISTGNVYVESVPFTSIDESLIIGAFQDSTGNKGRFWKGLLYDFKIFRRAMGEYETDKYLQTGKTADND